MMTVVVVEWGRTNEKADDTRRCRWPCAVKAHSSSETKCCMASQIMALWRCTDVVILVTAWQWRQGTMVAMRRATVPMGTNGNADERNTSPALQCGWPSVKCGESHCLFRRSLHRRARSVHGRGDVHTWAYLLFYAQGWQKYLFPVRFNLKQVPTLQ